MSTLLRLASGENPAPGFVVAGLNLLVALSLIGISLVLGIVISLLTWLRTIAVQPMQSLAGPRAAT